MGESDGAIPEHAATERIRIRGLGRRAWLVTWSIRLVLWVLGFTRLVRTTLVNEDVVPKRGAVLLAANHTSMIDVLFLLAALRRQAIAMAMAELWKSPFTRWLVEVLGQIPVVRGDPESGRQAMESAVEALRNGALVGIFPEQKCVKPGEVAPYRPGVAVLSKRTNTPIIPVGIINANKVLPLDRKIPSLRHTVFVVFGQPIDPEEFASVSDLLTETQLRITTLTRAPHR
ncbi:lysophospholipid acyltransferase family protein [Mycolicibacterium hippocampi]|jgi:1-acyl-sn-glycerol-3-phosphate acyltransferase|uniref:1-acyl-sn-glycerol-3-phosphate acyltransferase n=1 Tax=Mycolicibacterium hippocampi TaxID=659824 RepID=A0A850PM75_9MYCO|nr:lysophospholipid acyltransferase family protein [Mycolicibacterium hippocampi]NVN49250.1 1-acyl-sn-glycerol-3-phosphate acyltransferase [Mycolicibacterium hippocampi]